MKRIFFLLFFATYAVFSSLSCSAVKTQYFPANYELIRYTGRIDFGNPEKPRIWQPGVYIEAAFEGTQCLFIVHDQQLWGVNQNYLQVIIDDTISYRIQTKGATDTITLASNLEPGKHRITISKNTEANIGYIEFGGFITEKLIELPPAPERKIEFIGNSITCGASADISEIPCGQGLWHDQHNNWLSYGPITARNLKAQWQVNAVSGIGLIRSCCDLPILMPQVYDKIDQRGDSLTWDFSQYQPDLVTVCLGQNDGIQDSVAFCGAYVEFVQKLRGYYPKAQIVLLNSPMAHDELNVVLKNYINGVVSELNRLGETKVDKYFYSKRYYKGCDTHPNLEEHAEMAAELTAFLRNKMDWR